MYTKWLQKLQLTTLLAAASICPAIVRAVDIEAFEFNDPDFTELSAAANSVNNGNNWSDNIASSAVASGAFFIGKDNNDFSTSHLQIDNITAAIGESRFIVAEMTSWNFVGSVVGEGEELRFAFLADDTGTDGSTVTAEVRIDRNTDNEAIELRGLAVGPGSNNIANRATLNTSQNVPFTMVLELNKQSNTYEIFYKDGSNPSQSLGTGNVAPGRDGNSLRMVVNNNFGTDFSEFLNLDRVALTDVNPLDDLLTLQVNRDSGVMTLINSSGAALAGLQSYSMTSATGALNSAGWKPITDNYDNSAGPGDGSVDADDNWSISTTSKGELGEAADGGNGGSLAINQQVVLSQPGGSWIQTPNEDVRIELNFAGGVTRSANVDFIGNGGARFGVGDLNFDGILTVADWTIFIAGAETDLSSLSVAEAYQRGDLDGDGVNSIGDFGIFKTAYDEVNGAGAFAAMLATIPEPTTSLLVALAAACLAGRRGARELFLCTK